MSNKIKDTEFLYLTTMLRAREARMLTADRIGRLLDAPDYAEAAKYVTESGYPDMSGMTAQEIDNALSEYRTDVFRELEKNRQCIPLLDIFRVKYDYHNIKVLVKAMAANAQGDHLLSSSGRIPAAKLTEAFITGERRELPDSMRDAISRAVGILSRTSDPQLADIDIDRHYFNELCKLADVIDISFITGYVSLLIDSANLRTVVRTLRMKKDMDLLKKALFTGGTVRPDRLFAVSPSGEALKELYSSDILEKAAELGHATLTGSSLTLFEQECDNALIRYLNKAKLVSFGMEPVVAHLAALEAEIMSIRMILTGKLSGISPEIIRERLRTIYV